MRLVAAMFFVCLLHAQTPLASISGVVQDPHGSVVANDEVSALHLETGVRVSTRTNSTGF